MTSAGARRAIYLDEIGVGPLWLRRETPPAVGGGTDFDAGFTVVPRQNSLPDSTAVVHAPVAAYADAPPAPEIAGMNWAELKSNVAGCVKCGLCRGRTQTVFGVGDEKAKWLLVGEGPGRNEDLQGEPFIGQAGKLLDNMLLAMGLRRGENTYIANIVKCRPTDETGRDRPPTPEEAAACLPYLERQVALIQPTVIVALGKTAALSLLGLPADTPVSRLRGRVHQYTGRPLIVTYHPAYLLRNMADKKKAWADLSLAMTTYAGAD